MYPILARYGPFFLYSYNVVMGLGIAASVGLTVWLEKRDAKARPGWFDGLLVALVAGLIGGRIGFVWANWSYFQEEPGEIGLVWHGGLSYHGALLAALLAFWVWSSRQKYQFGAYTDLLAPALALGCAFGWLACYLEGCAFGRETVLGSNWLNLFMADLPDSYGVFGLRYQTQLLALGFSLLAFGTSLALLRSLVPGQLFLTTLLVLSLGRLVVSILRGDALPMVGLFRLDTIADAALIVFCVILWIMIGRRHPMIDDKKPTLDNNP